MKTLNINKGKYIILPDIHLWFKNISNRFDYRNEIFSILDKILGDVREWKSKGEPVEGIIFMGDIFHQGYNESSGIVLDDYLYFEEMSKLCNLYVLIGNHEITYYKKNPIYKMIDLEDLHLTNLVSKSRVKSTRKSGGFIKAVNELVCGNTSIYFNHFGEPCQTPLNKFNIGMFHDTFLPAELEDVYKSNNIDVLTEYVERKELPFEGKYDMYFIGHIHTMNDHITADIGDIYYTGTIGRTNISEVEKLVGDKKYWILVISDTENPKCEFGVFTYPMNVSSNMPKSSKIQGIKYAQDLKKINYLGEDLEKSIVDFLYSTDLTSAKIYENLSSSNLLEDLASKDDYYKSEFANL